MLPTSSSGLQRNLCLIASTIDHVEEANLFVIVLEENPVWLEYETNQFGIVAVITLAKARKIRDERPRRRDVGYELTSDFLTELLFDVYANVFDLLIERWREDNAPHAPERRPFLMRSEIRWFMSSK